MGGRKKKDASSVSSSTARSNLIRWGEKDRTPWGKRKRHLWVDVSVDQKGEGEKRPSILPTGEGCSSAIGADYRASKGGGILKRKKEGKFGLLVHRVLYRGEGEKGGKAAGRGKREERGRAEGRQLRREHWGGTFCGSLKEKRNDAETPLPALGRRPSIFPSKKVRRGGTRNSIPCLRSFLIERGISLSWLIEKEGGTGLVVVLDRLPLTLTEEEKRRRDIPLPNAKRKGRREKGRKVGFSLQTTHRQVWCERIGEKRERRGRGTYNSPPTFDGKGGGRSFSGPRQSLRKEGKKGISF